MNLSGAAVSALVVLGILSPSEGSEAPAAQSPALSVEGVSLGESLREVDQRFDLSSLNASERDGKQYFVLQPPTHFLKPLDEPVSGLRSLVLVFDEDRVVEVGASYVSKAVFSRMGLVEIYGEPTSIVAPPRQRRHRPEGGDFAVWNQVWTWEREEGTLTVTGVHYTGPEDTHIARGQHFFHFRLALPGTESP